MNQITLTVLLGLVFCSAQAYYGAFRRSRDWKPKIPFGHRTVVHEWAQLEFDWDSEAQRQAAIASGQYIPDNNVFSGIKVYKGRVFVTVPRWRFGVPSTFNEVIVKNGRPVLKPFPNWEIQDLNNCSAFQYTMSMEIDPKSGLLYILDTGRINIFPPPGTDVVNLCPNQIFIYDLENDRFVQNHTFPESVAPAINTFLNDIVIDNQGFAYISDASDNGGMIVYDMYRDRSHRHEHPAMDVVPGPAARTFNVNTGYSNDTYFFDGPMNGMAMSPDFQYIYFSVLTGFDLFQLPTSLARNPNADISNAVRNVGQKLGQSGGIAHGEKNLYYGALPMSAVYYWQKSVDQQLQGGPERALRMETQKQLEQNTIELQSPDTFAWDESGFLWMTSNRLLTFLASPDGLDQTGRRGSNFRINRFYVGEQSYLNAGAPLQEPTKYKCNIFERIRKARQVCRGIFWRRACIFRATRYPSIVYSCYH